MYNVQGYNNFPKISDKLVLIVVEVNQAIVNETKSL